jgi:hypothetical protein
LCQHCGAVYRNPVVPELNAVHYQTPAGWGGANMQQVHEAFAQRLEGR